uniref:Lipid droplet-associated hydrolase n=1 Tax=Acrobeloides nanus TaxID=290746 RepID=A0A914CGJ7_9BILA
MFCDGVENSTTNDIPDTVILMIPGNPGNEGFYAKFGELLLEALDEKGTTNSRFITVSHINHVPIPSELKPASISQDRFLLEEQVQHKLEFCRKHLPHAKKIYLLGHSIGAYMMLRILQDLLEEKFNIEAAYALFPTVEYMADSPNGRRLGPILRFFDSKDWLIKLVSFWTDFVPLAFKKWLCSWNLSHPEVPECVLDSAAELGNSLVLRNIIHMSNDELNTVLEVEENLLSNPEKTFFYYGTSDGWVPLSYAERMKTNLPNGHVFLDESDCEHAFVIKDGEIMAQVMAKLIRGSVHINQEIT